MYPLFSKNHIHLIFFLVFSIKPKTKKKTLFKYMADIPHETYIAISKMVLRENPGLFSRLLLRLYVKNLHLVRLHPGTEDQLSGRSSGSSYRLAAPLGPPRMDSHRLQSQSDQKTKTPVPEILVRTDETVRTHVVASGVAGSPDPVETAAIIHCTIEKSRYEESRVKSMVVEFLTPLGLEIKFHANILELHAKMLHADSIAIFWKDPHKPRFDASPGIDPYFKFRHFFVGIYQQSDAALGFSVLKDNFLNANSHVWPQLNVFITFSLTPNITDGYLCKLDMNPRTQK
jgi:hypothetical protein